jgi:LPS-assembly lipoprotein
MRRVDLLFGRFTIVMLASLLSLSACGFKPLYSRAGGTSTSAQLAQIHVAPVSDTSGDAYIRDYYRQGRTSRLGQLFQDGLERQLSGERSSPYRLQLSIEERIEGLGIRPDESFTRQRISLIARYELIDVSQNKPLYRGEAKSEIGVDRVASEYATLTAERAAGERNAQLLVRQITAKLLVLRGDLTVEDGLGLPLAPDIATPGNDPLSVPQPPKSDQTTPDAPK